MSITTDWERLSSSDINNEKSGPEPSKPEYLYAYTDPNATGTPLYAWDEYNTIGGGLTGITYYTTSDNPVINDPLLDSNGEVVGSAYYVGTTPSNGKFYIGQTPSILKGIRNTSKDIVSQLPSTVYTDSDTLVVGMTLYDNTGTDTGYVIAVINQDGSFDIR